MTTFAILAFAMLQAASPYPADADCENYGDGSTAAMSECLSAQSNTWNQRLNVEYREALKRGEIKASKLRSAQRAWLRYRDANCEAYYSVKGTISTTLTGHCYVDMTRARALELHEMSWLG
jgi:uncharacterized protein YecT (DUF1311 family)